MKDRLESWKEIAAYLNRSVRTVRRWERGEGLPVHRHVHHRLASVYAFKSELDEWRNRTSSTPEPPVKPDTRSIVVLPFVELGAEDQSAHFAYGLTEQVISDLSRLRDLRVISFTSSITLKDTKKDVRRIGRELNVRYVVEGSVRRSDTLVRVSARLIDARTDTLVWSEQYEGVLEEVFTIQERLARTIVGTLQLQLDVDEDRRLSARPFADIAAFECYVQARQEAFRWRHDAIDHAVQLLQNGLNVVGENIRLYATLGRVHLQYRETGIDLSERPIEEAERCGRRIAEINPTSPERAQLYGWIHYMKGDIQSAVRELKLALESGWNDPDVLNLLSNCYLISGRVAHARPLIERLVAVDPLTPLSRCMPGYADLLDGNLSAAIGSYRQMFEMDEGNPLGRLFYVWVLGLNDRRTEALRVADALPPALEDSIPGRVSRFLAQALNSQAVDDSEVRGVDELTGATDVFPRMLAHGYAWASMPDEATHWLEIAAERGFINYPFLAIHDPAFAELRAHPRFARLLDRVRSRWESFEA